MIRLDTINRSLTLVLSAAKTTNDMPVTVTYSDRSQTGTLPVEGSNLTTSNGTSVRTICAAPASSTIIRGIEYVSVYNADTVVQTVNISVLDTATYYTVIKCTLAVGDTLTYSPQDGWKVIDTTGAEKYGISLNSVALTGIPTAPTPAAGTNNTQIATTAFVSYVYLGSVTASSSSTVDFTGLSGSSYKKFVVIATDVVPGTNAVFLYMRISTGSGFIAAGYTDETFRFTNAGSGIGGGSAAAQFDITGAAESLGTAAGELPTFEIDIHGANTTTAYKSAIWKYSGKMASAAYITGIGGGVVASSAAVIDGIRFLTSSGNIASGTFTLYGVKPS
jgi:hypothetical protein